MIIFESFKGLHSGALAGLSGIRLFLLLHRLPVAAAVAAAAVAAKAGGTNTQPALCAVN